MQPTVKRYALGALACLPLALAVAGCSGPQAVPIDKRAPGQDITATARADKRGNVTGAQTAPAGK
jgi:hypothetical protein